MIFNSLQYAVFLPVVLALYWSLRTHRRQNVLLAVASYVFYGAWDWRFLGLMWLTTAVDFWVGRRLADESVDRKRTALFLTSLVLNLTVLGFFKYFDFFADSAVDLLDTLGVQANRPTLEILLPIGISFYTFHGISYTFDIFRRHIEPVRDPLTFAVFVAYFPQLVAGPIGRAHIQIPQFDNPRSRPGRDEIRSAFLLILLGLFKKVAIADALAPFVDSAFGQSRSASALTLMAGAYAFALQIYGDFSGYSDIARGSSRLFGIELIKNFEQPYLSRNPAAFWRTWHISLSTWLRDYLYVPLGGNRRGERKTYRNLMITMILGGLWHGAAWTFVVWGALHGLFLVAHRRFGDHRLGAQAERSFRWRSDLLPAIGTFHLVCLAWVFFRADSFGQAFRYLGGIVTLRPGGIGLDFLALLVPAALAIVVLDLVQRNGADHTALLAWPVPARGLAYGAFVVAIIVFSGGTPVPFIYFQF